MTPAQRIHELIMCPLERCYPGKMPRKRKHTPDGLAALIRKVRQKQPGKGWTGSGDIRWGL